MKQVHFVSTASSHSNIAATSTLVDLLKSNLNTKWLRVRIVERSVTGLINFELKAFEDLWKTWCFF